jgi:trehalose 6-phosphate synthase
MSVSATVRARQVPADLGPAFRDAFPAARLLVVSNREPYEHVWDDERDEIEVRRPPGGLVSALDPLVQSVGGVWVAWGSGDADREAADSTGRVRVPPEEPRYSLRRVWLTQRDIRQYYQGYANQLLWPLCHLRPGLTHSSGPYWERYRQVNQRFAEAALEEAGSEAAIWFHDYHLALAPGFVRRANAGHKLAHFWHIPFPPLELFRILTHGEALLEGLIANHLLGFHLPLFCDNFMRCAESVLGADVDWEQRAVHYDGHTCFVRALPISIDVDAFESRLAEPTAEAAVRRLRTRYGGGAESIGIGVDRIDYSKGLEEKLAALDLMWERNPEMREHFTFVQVAVPSRTGIDAYDWLSETVERMAWSINDRWGTVEWKPVHLIKESLPPERLALFYRAADLCIVSSLQDGMNLVAKEYVASHGPDGAGVLVLSRFAGAVEELDGCVPVNPYDADDFATRIREAILMPVLERRERMDRLYTSLRSIYDWMIETFEAWQLAADGETPPLTAIDRSSRAG